MTHALDSLRRLQLDVVLSPVLYQDHYVDSIIQQELGQRYQVGRQSTLREGIEPETAAYLAFIFGLTLVPVVSGFLSELGKDLYRTTKRIFLRHRDQKEHARSSPAFFHAQVKAGDIDIRFVFQVDAYPDPESFGSMFERVVNSARDMVEHDPRMQRCKEVKYQWDSSIREPVPWEAEPRGFPAETREFYEWQGQDWELRRLGG